MASPAPAGPATSTPTWEDVARDHGRFLYTVAYRRGVAVTIVANSWFRVPQHPLVSRIVQLKYADPSNLAAPMTGTFTVAAKGVDTGIAMRSEHARDEYLHAAKHPTVGFTLTRTVAVRQDGDALVFRGAGSIALMGKDLPVEVTGTMRAPDAAGRTRLGLAERKVLVVQADFSFKISESPLAVDRSSFDADLVPIHVSLVLAQ